MQQKISTQKGKKKQSKPRGTTLSLATWDTTFFSLTTAKTFFFSSSFCSLTSTFALLNNCFASFRAGPRGGVGVVFPPLGPRQPPRLIKMLISAHRLADIPVRLPAASRVSPPFPMCPCFPVSLSPFSSVSPRVPPWTRSLSRPSPLLSHFVPLSRHAAVVSFPIFPTFPPRSESVGIRG